MCTLQERETQDSRNYQIRNPNGGTGTTKSSMTAQAASRIPKDHPAKKPGKSRLKEEEGKDSLYEISEHSLSGFLESEPDIYTVSDIKVRYR
jgi:hypothetical protein